MSSHSQRAAAPPSAPAAAHARSSSAVKTLSRLISRSRCSTGAKSVREGAHDLLRRAVRGAQRRGARSSSVAQLAHQPRRTRRRETVGCVEHVVAEGVLLELLRQLGVPARGACAGAAVDVGHCARSLHGSSARAASTRRSGRPGRTPAWRRPARRSGVRTTRRQQPGASPSRRHSPRRARAPRRPAAAPSPVDGTTPSSRPVPGLERPARARRSSRRRAGASRRHRAGPAPRSSSTAGRGAQQCTTVCSATAEHGAQPLAGELRLGARGACRSRSRWGSRAASTAGSDGSSSCSTSVVAGKPRAARRRRAAQSLGQARRRSRTAPVVGQHPLAAVQLEHRRERPGPGGLHLEPRRRCCAGGVLEGVEVARQQVAGARPSRLGRGRRGASRWAAGRRAGRRAGRPRGRRGRRAGRGRAARAGAATGSCRGRSGRPRAGRCPAASRRRWRCPGARGACRSRLGAASARGPSAGGLRGSGPCAAGAFAVRRLAGPRRGAWTAAAARRAPQRRAGAAARQARSASSAAITSARGAVAPRTARLNCWITSRSVS